LNDNKPPAGKLKIAGEKTEHILSNFPIRKVE
jgi:hypothetical protein